MIVTRYCISFPLTQAEQYYYAARAFDVLERLDPSPDYWEGKRGACVGAFQAFLKDPSAKDQFREVIAMLRASTNPQVDFIVRVMKNHAKENRIAI